MIQETWIYVGNSFTQIKYAICFFKLMSIKCNMDLNGKVNSLKSCILCEVIINIVQEVFSSL